MVVVNDMVLRIRSELNDTDVSHLIRHEIPEGIIDGTNKIYYLEYYPVVSEANIWITVDGAGVTSPNFTVDTDKAIITLTTAPATSITVDYYFYAFNDDDIKVWIDHGMQICGRSNFTTLEFQLEAAVEHLAIAMGCDAMARKYAEGFSWHIGPESVDKDKISAKYKDLAEKTYKQGIEQRDGYYKRLGAREAPAFAIGTMCIPTFEVKR